MIVNINKRYLKVRLWWFKAGLANLRYRCYLSLDLNVLYFKRKVIFSSIMQYKQMCNQIYFAENIN